MKKWHFIILVLVMTLGVNSMVSAALISDDASDPAYTSDGWQAGDNGGDGGAFISPWQFFTTSVDGGQNGHFHGTSTDIGTGGGNNAWCMYANGSQQADAVRPFTTMQSGDILRISMDNGNIDTGGTVGVSLRNGSDNNVVDFFFTGGNANYTYTDNDIPMDSGVPFTSGGLDLAFTINSGGAFQLAITPVGGSTTTVSGTLANPAGGQSVSQLRLFNANAGSGSDKDACFNSLELEGPTAVELEYFTVNRAENDQIEIDWETSNEVNHAGFNIYRRAANSRDVWTKINDSLIASEGTQAQGAIYKEIDETVTAGTWEYLLEDVDTSGLKFQHSDFIATVTVGAPTAVMLTSNNTSSLSTVGILIILAGLMLGSSFLIVIDKKRD